MSYFDNWFEGEQDLSLDELSDTDIMSDPFEGDTAVDSSFEEDYFDNYDLYRLKTNRREYYYWKNADELDEG